MEVPTAPSSGSINFREQLTELRETVTFTNSSKDMIEDTDAPPDEEIHRVGSEGSQTQGFLSLWTGGESSPQCGCVHHLGSSPHLILMGFHGVFLIEA